MAGRKTRSTNEILVDILNELAEHTDSEHGLTVKELSDRVGATEKTVHAHLQLLEAQRPMGRTVRRLTVQLTQTMQKKRLAEKRFEELEHSASVSQISSIVAHELRQPLAAITNFCDGHSTPGCEPDAHE